MIPVLSWDISGYIVIYVSSVTIERWKADFNALIELLE